MEDTAKFEILGAINTLSTQIDGRLDRLEGRVTIIEMNMVTRDHFERRMDKVDGKFDKITSLLHEKDIFSRENILAVSRA